MVFDDGCGRYGADYNPHDFMRRYDLPKVPKGIRPSYDVKPGHTMPIIIESQDGERNAEMMKWGLIPTWSKDPKIGYKLFNARDDRVFSSPVWRSVILKKRALIPATLYFEWTKPPKGSKEPKRKFLFRPKQLDIFSFAGVWDSWKDAEGKEWMTYSIITTEPNKEARKIHDRMPVILHPEDEPKWLEPSRTERKDIEPFLRPLEDNGLEVVEVSSDVNNLEYDDKTRIAALNSQ